MPSSPNGAVLRGADAAVATPYLAGAFRHPSAAPSVTTVGGTGRAQVRLDDVYADEIERLREKARESGYDQGYTEGMAAAADAVAEVRAAAQRELEAAQAAWEQQMASAMTALQVAVQRLDGQSQPAADAMTAAIAENTFTLLSDMLGRELRAATDPGGDAIRRALALCPSDGSVVVRIHPDDHTALPEDTLAALPDTVVLRADPSVEPAGAVAEAGARRVDAQLGAALERVRTVLSQ